MDTLFIFFLILHFGYPYCIKVTFSNNYRYDAVSIGLISDRTKVSCSQTGFKSIETNINSIILIYELVKKHILSHLRTLVILNVSLNEH